MVRTKADAAGTRIAAAKAPRKLAASTSRAGANSASPKVGSSKDKFSGGNSYNPQPVPNWQKGISTFFKNKTSPNSEKKKSSAENEDMETESSAVKENKETYSSADKENVITESSADKENIEKSSSADKENIETKSSANKENEERSSCHGEMETCSSDQNETSSEFTKNGLISDDEDTD